MTQINDELVALCNWLKQRGDLETASRLAPIVDSLTRVLIQIAEHMIVSQLPERVAVMAGLASLLFSKR